MVALGRERSGEARRTRLDGLHSLEQLGKNRERPPLTLDSCHWRQRPMFRVRQHTTQPAAANLVPLAYPP